MSAGKFRLCGVFVLFLLLAAAQAQAGEIRGIGNMCLDVKGRGGKGTQVVIWPCSGQQNQDWYYDVAAKSISTPGGLCLDVKGGGGKGSPVIVWSCNGQPNQMWYQNTDGTIRTASGLCLDVKGGKAAKGANVTVWPCKSSNNANQKWH